MKFYKKIKSIVGNLYLIANDSKLLEIVFESSWPKYNKKELKLNADHEILLKTETQLNEYFNGTRKKFDIPYELVGTDLQIKTWQALASIPYGNTISYSSQAKAIKKPKAMRFVGTTNGKNPIPIILPCHRVIGKDGSLTGYGGGISIKKTLLKLEASIK